MPKKQQKLNAAELNAQTLSTKEENITWADKNRDKCQKHWRDYRQRNLETVRYKQREAYRSKHHVSPENYRNKLDAEKVLNMRSQYAEGKSLGMLATNYGVSEKTAYDAITGVTWKKLPLPNYEGRRRPNRGRHVKR